MVDEEFELLLALEGVVFGVLGGRIRGLFDGCRGEVGEELVRDLRGDVFGDV